MNKHISYKIYKQLVGDNGVTEWVKFNWLSNDEPFSVVDLGTLNWSYADSYANPVFTVKLTDAKGNDTGKAKAVCDLYTVHYGDYTRMPDMTIQIRTRGTYNVFVRNTNYTDAASFKAAMSGVYLYYETK